jgi:prolycopene isomerase
MADFDDIIIGSGLGGLTCGAFLAKSGRRVCVLEQHHKIGGYAHGFSRKGYTFESGIHCVPISQHGIVKRVLSMLGSPDSIETIALPSMYAVRTQDDQFSVPALEGPLVEALTSRFPHEQNAIAVMLSEMREFYDILERPLFDSESGQLEKDRTFISQFYNQSYQTFIEARISDPLLRHYLYAMWPYGGTSPDAAPVLYYTIMFIVHVLEGAHYVKGGFGSIASVLAGIITNAGGVIKTGTKATSLTCEGDRVRAVTTESGETIEADRFISNISPYHLHFDLLDEEYQSRRWQRRLSQLNPAVSSVSVYCGMKPGFEALLPDHITFTFAHQDHAKIYADILANEVRPMDHLLLLRSAGSLHAPTVTLMQFFQQTYSKNWHEDKQQIAQAMLLEAEKLYPGFTSYLELFEVGSPDTFERYTANTNGSLYGFENTKRVYGEAKLPIETHLKNLFQTGHWGRPGGGVQNVMVNGYSAFKLMTGGTQQL